MAGFGFPHSYSGWRHGKSSLERTLSEPAFSTCHSRHFSEILFAYFKFFFGSCICLSGILFKNFAVFLNNVKLQMSSFPPGSKRCWRAQLVMDSSKEGMSPESLFSGEGLDTPQGGKPLVLRTIFLSWHCSFAVAVSHSKNHCYLLRKEKNRRNAQRASVPTVCSISPQLDLVLSNYRLLMLSWKLVRELKTSHIVTTFWNCWKPATSQSLGELEREGWDKENFKSTELAVLITFLLNKCSLNCGKLLVNLQNSGRVNFNHFFASVLVALMEECIFGAPCSMFLEMLLIFRISLYKNKCRCYRGRNNIW